MREECQLRVWPLAQLLRVPLDLGDQFRFDGIPVGHLHGRREHVLERERAELGQHHHQPARVARRDGGQWPFGGRMMQPVGSNLRQLLEKLRRGACGRDAAGVDTDDLFRARIVNERLRFAAPAHVVVHRANHREHGAGGVDGIAAALERAGAGHGPKRLARDGHPMPAVQRRLVRGGIRLRRRGETGSRCETDQEPEQRNGECFHGWAVRIRRSAPRRQGRMIARVSEGRSFFFA